MIQKHNKNKNQKSTWHYAPKGPNCLLNLTCIHVNTLNWYLKVHDLNNDLKEKKADKCSMIKFSNTTSYPKAVMIVLSDALVANFAVFCSIRLFKITSWTDLFWRKYNFSNIFNWWYLILFVKVADNTIFYLLFFINLRNRWWSEIWFLGWN